MSNNNYMSEYQPDGSYESPQNTIDFRTNLNNQRMITYNGDEDEDEHNETYLKKNSFNYQNSNTVVKIKNSNNNSNDFSFLNFFSNLKIFFGIGTRDNKVYPNR